jgi:APA family basic amino acid/polyamine antiporter
MPDRLRRIVGVSFGIAVVVGGTVGAGILRVPGTIAAALGRADLIIAAWILVGLIAALGANCYAELATTMPTAGGPFVFVRRAFGNFAGFASGWSDWLVQLCAVGYLAVALGEYAGAFFPAFPHRESILGIACLTALTAFNLLGLRVGATVQQWTSAAKALGLLGIVLACLMHTSEAAVLSSPSLTHMGPAGPLAALILSIRTISETYSGWNGVVYFSEDQRDPATNLPRSLFWGLASIVLLYVLVNGALLMVLPIDTLSASKLAVADAAQVVFGGVSGRLVTIFSIVSLVGILNLIVMAAPRILFGLTRDGFMVKNAGQLNRAGAPGIAMIFTWVAAVTLILVGSFDVLFGMAGFLGIAVDAAVYASLFRLRRTEPDLLRPYEALGYPWLPMLPLVIALALLAGLIYEDFKMSLFTVATLGLSFPLYALAKRGRRDSSATTAIERD